MHQSLHENSTCINYVYIACSSYKISGISQKCLKEECIVKLKLPVGRLTLHEIGQHKVTNTHSNVGHVYVHVYTCGYVLSS